MEWRGRIIVAGLAAILALASSAGAQTVTASPGVDYSTSGYVVAGSAPGALSVSMPVVLSVGNSSTDNYTTNFTIANDGTAYVYTQPVPPPGSTSTDMFQIVGYGYQLDSNVQPGPWVNGGDVNVTIAPSTAIYAYNDYAPLGMAVSALSFGSDGYANGTKDPIVATFNGNDAGTVTITHSADASVVLVGAGVATMTITDVREAAGALAGVARGGNGAAIKAHSDAWAGPGGAGGTVKITTDALSSLTVSNPSAASDVVYTAAIIANSVGGTPGAQDGVAATVGGSQPGGPVTVTHNGNIINTATSGIGIMAASTGGNGGEISAHDDENYRYGASAGGGDVTVTVNGTVSMAGVNGIGVVAASLAGGSTPNAQAYENPTSGDVNVTVGSGGSILTNGSDGYNIGVLAISSGSASRLNPFGAGLVSSSGNGTSGQVTVTNNGTVTTAGEFSIGLAALAVGGAGTVSAADNSGISYLGNNSYVYDAQGATVGLTNSGSVTTLGASAHGLVATSSAGGGLLRVVEEPQWDVSSSTAATLLSGSIVRQQQHRHGRQLRLQRRQRLGDEHRLDHDRQRRGHGGGLHRHRRPVDRRGRRQRRRVARVGPSSAITAATAATAGPSRSALGAAALSRRTISARWAFWPSRSAAGGGNGANASGAFVATGGNGGSGGSGGSVNVTFKSGNRITTGGDFLGRARRPVDRRRGRQRRIRQRLRGIPRHRDRRHGRRGRYGRQPDRHVGRHGHHRRQPFRRACSSSPSAAAGARAGPPTPTPSASSSTWPSRSAARAARAATPSAPSARPTAARSPPASRRLSAKERARGLTAPTPTGLVVQAIAGGGGKAGAATAKAYSFPVDDVPINASVTVACGGSGGSGGSVVNPAGSPLSATNLGSITTYSDNSYGVLAQSIGGGGGIAGDATAASWAFHSGVPSVQISASHGGTGGEGGSGDAVVVYHGDTDGTVASIFTLGQSSCGIVAQSIGGGGGAGGTGNSSDPNPAFIGKGQSFKSTTRPGRQRGRRRRRRHGQRDDLRRQPDRDRPVRGDGHPGPVDRRRGRRRRRRDGQEHRHDRDQRRLGRHGRRRRVGRRRHRGQRRADRHRPAATVWPSAPSRSAAGGGAGGTSDAAASISKKGQIARRPRCPGHQLLGRRLHRRRRGRRRAGGATSRSPTPPARPTPTASTPTARGRTACWPSRSPAGAARAGRRPPPATPRPPPR